MRTKRGIALFLTIIMLVSDNATSVFADNINTTIDAITCEETGLENDAYVNDVSENGDVSDNDNSEKITDTNDVSEEEMAVTLPDDISSSDNNFNADATNIASGTYENVNWYIDSTGCLYVNGTGEFAKEDGRPSSIGWYKYASRITSATINLSRTQNASYMFFECTKLEKVNLSNFKTNNVTNMSRMFASAINLTQVDVSMFDTSYVTDMSYMFAGCDVKELNLNNFHTNSLTNMCGMFNCCTDLVQIKWDNIDTSLVYNMECLFNWCFDLKSIDLSKFNTNSLISMYSMFSGCRSLTELDLSTFNTSKVKWMRQTFEGCENLTKIKWKPNTSSVTDMCSMFNNCKSLKEIDLSSFNTSNVTNMNRMFSRCSSLSSIDVSRFDTQNVTDMCGMFEECSSLKHINLDNFNTKKVTNMNYMFSKCSGLEDIDISHFDTSKNDTMSNMFQGCSLLEEIDLSNLNISKLGSISDMFKDCINLKQVKFNTSQTATLYGPGVDSAFYGCKNLTEIDLSMFDAIKVNSPYSKDLFTGCNKLNKIITPLNLNISIPLPGSSTGSNNSWYDGKNNTYTELPKNVSYGITLTRTVPEGKKHTITYKNCSGAVNSNANFYEEGEGLTLIPATKNGYTFVGWYTDSNCTKKITSIPANAKKNYTLYAKWKSISYKVTFNNNKNSIKDYCGEKALPSSGSMSKQTINGGTGAKLKGNAFKITGYNFVGWNTKPDGTGDSYSNSQKVTYFNGSSANITLYAIWKKCTYNIIYNGLTADEVAAWKLPTNYQYDSATINFSNYLPLISRKGYTFKGLYQSKEGTFGRKKYEKIPTYSTGNKTVYVQIDPIEYSVFLYRNQSNSDTKNTKKALKYDKTLKLANPYTLSGYKFIGWNTHRDGSGTSYTNNEVVKNLTTVAGTKINLYAQWEIIHYSITYDGLKDYEIAFSGLPTSYTVKDETIVFSNYTAKIQRVGYNLAKYYTDAKHTKSISKISKGSTKNYKIYVYYKPNEFQIQFYRNQSSEDTKKVTQTIKYNALSSSQLNSNTFSRTGYKFVGWNTKKDGSGTAYSNKAGIKNNVCSEEGEKYKLYAQWELVTYSIKYIDLTEEEISRTGLPRGYTIKDPNIKLSNYKVVAPGETFKGFYTKSGSAYKTIETGNAKNITLYAKWIANQYYIKYSANVSDGSVKGSMTVSKGTYDSSKVLRANEYTREGYVFAGWNTKSDGSGNSYADKASVAPLATKTKATSTSGNVVLYAQWKKNGVHRSDVNNFSKGEKGYLNTTFYNKLQEVVLSGNPVEDMIKIAESQLGYYGSEINQDCRGLEENKKDDGANEYARWMGNGNYAGTAGWCNFFITWCMYMADIPGVDKSINYLTSNTYGKKYDFNYDYRNVSSSIGQLRRGDILKMSTGHVCIVTGVDAEKGLVNTIDGNWSCCVKTKTINSSDISKISCFWRITE